MSSFKIRIFLFVILIQHLGNSAQARDYDILYGAGFSVATRNAQMPRLGPDFNIFYGDPSWGNCSGCSGIGAVVGVARFKEKEYYLGPAAFANLFAVTYAELAIHMREDKMIGARGTVSLGLFLMPFLSIGVDTEHSGPQLEAGLSFKIPVLNPDRGDD